jgi:shikimate kinase/3-dehydroquinate synthase
VGGVARIVLIGFSGTGKTTVARHLAERLGWSAIDTDASIEQTWDASIPEIFRDFGESAFRERERAVLRDASRQDRVVIATGGGAVVEADAWGDDLLGREGTLVVALDARPETMLARLTAQSHANGATVERPLLAAADPLRRITDLKASRQHAYDAGHLTVVVDGVEADAAADELHCVVRAMNGEPLMVRLEAASGASDILIAPGALATLGTHVRERWPRARRVWLITDAHVEALHAPAAEVSLLEAGFIVQTRAVPAGEGSKSLGMVSALYDWLLGGGIERGDVMVALGGGVVGDLAGFVAATVLRGVGLVQVPTSLLAAVDSSVGGKTGVNHATGKNLIGAFLQPPLVLVDPSLLRTLPERELRSGFAEIVKHAIIQRSTPGGERGDLATFLRRNVRRLLALEEPATAYLIWRNIALKSAVVQADERERGIRAFLNFGHTLGHAIEASNYRHLHGEAVALGMRAAAALGVMAGSCGAMEAEKIERLIDLFDLPGTAPLDEARVFGLLGSDKKRIGGRQRFILPVDGGGVEIRENVPETAVRRALEHVTARAAVA